MRSLARHGPARCTDRGRRRADPRHSADWLASARGRARCTDRGRRRADPRHSAIRLLRRGAEPDARTVVGEAPTRRTGPCAPFLVMAEPDVPVRRGRRGADPRHWADSLTSARCRARCTGRGRGRADPMHGPSRLLPLSRPRLTQACPVNVSATCSRHHPAWSMRYWESPRPSLRRADGFPPLPAAWSEPRRQVRRKWFTRSALSGRPELPAPAERGQSRPSACVRPGPASPCISQSLSSPRAGELGGGREPACAWGDEPVSELGAASAIPLSLRAGRERAAPCCRVAPARRARDCRSVGPVPWSHVVPEGPIGRHV
jgi:hypothetical protein